MKYCLLVAVVDKESSKRMTILSLPVNEKPLNKYYTTLSMKRKELSGFLYFCKEMVKHFFFGALW